MRSPFYAFGDLIDIRNMPVRKQLAQWFAYLVAVLCGDLVAAARDRIRASQFEQALQLDRTLQISLDQNDVVDRLLCAMLPNSAMQKLLCGIPVRDVQPCATVMFSDMVQFTAWSSKRTAREVVAMLNVVVPLFDDWSVVAGSRK